MLSIPTSVRTQFQNYLRQKTVPNTIQGAYLKWLRYYWDFCHKYHFPHNQRDSLPHFLRKLQEKHQTKVQQDQAAQAIGMYYEMCPRHAEQEREQTPQGTQPAGRFEHPPGPPQGGNTTPRPSQGGNITPSLSQGGKTTPHSSQEEKRAADRTRQPGRGTSWKAEYDRWARLLEERSYPPKTAKAYMKWIRKFQAFTQSQEPKTPP